MRFRGGITVAALAAAAAVLLVGGQSRADELAAPDDRLIVGPGTGAGGTGTGAFAPYAVPLYTPYGGQPYTYGWAPYGPPAWPPYSGSQIGRAHV